MDRTLREEAKAKSRLDWRKKISDHVAYALLVYTGLQIFVTLHQIKGGSHSVLPYFALIVLVAGIIPACRFYEKRWESLDGAAASDPALAGAFRRDTIIIWLGAIGLPFLLTGLIAAFA